MASKLSMANPVLLVILAMAVLVLAASSAHAQAPAPAPAQSLCPNGFSNIQALETAARALVDKVEIIFVPRLMDILDSTLAELGLLHPSVELCVCGPNPQFSPSGMEPEIKCFGGNITL